MKLKIKVKNSDKTEMKDAIKAGMVEEKKDHLKTFHGDLETIMKIVKDHLKLDPKYYDEEEDKAEGEEGKDAMKKK
jgi:hypothetical protein